MRIIYMGTPDFAVESLRVLVENKCEIVGVVTMPDKPAGRGHKIQFSPVKQYALDQNIPLLQPTNLKDESFIEELRALQADLQIVVAFRMLPEIVWDMPRLGTFNLHASLLPQYRGAAPINWAVINGEKETGITTFFLKHAIDTGNIIHQEKVTILDEDNAGTVHDKLMELGGRLVLKTVQDIENGNVNERPQPEGELKAAPKIFKDTCLIDWNQNSEKIHNMIRGLSPYPAAWAKLQQEDKKDMNVKIYESSVELAVHTHNVGTVICDHKKELKVATIDGYIHILTLQLAGKKRMPIDALLRGYTISDNAQFV